MSPVDGSRSRLTARVTGFRWGTLAVGAALGAPGLAAGDLRHWAAVALLVADAAGHTLAPLRRRLARHAAGDVVVGALGPVAAVAMTGWWTSPFVFSLVPVVMAAGFTAGLTGGLAAALAVGTVITVFDLAGVDGSLRPGAERALQWGAMLGVVAVTADLARRLAEERSRALEHLDRLAEANMLLHALHRAAQDLPASLDADTAQRSVLDQVTGLLAAPAGAVIIHDDTTGTWVPGPTRGGRSRGGPSADPPPVVRAALDDDAGVHVAGDLTALGGGVVLETGSAVCAVLRCRGAVVGAVVAEHPEQGAFSARDAAVIAGITESAALALDNARWFARLRTLGAEEERARIARDLHDRVGQSLAFLSFELDRLQRAAARGEDVGDALARLRDEVRAVVSEVRDALHDLRTEVTDEVPLGRVVAGFLERVRQRSGLEVELVDTSTGRLPVRRERELWRIAQEAIVNAERHARARRIRVSWDCDGRRARLEVRDDGVGLAATTPREDSYGLVGMRERAAGIGARLRVVSDPGGGTVVVCEIEPDGDTDGDPPAVTGRQPHLEEGVHP